MRELARQPGSTLYRLLTDPASGRCVERSISAYRFDAAMRAQITFADVTCRAPGCTVPAGASEFDHVQEYDTPGGQTRESNGALLHGHHHQSKTEKDIDVAIDANRTMTWTTLLGRIYQTKAHDYRQYAALLSEAVARVTNAATDETARADAVDAAIYAALTHRDADETLALPEDYDEPLHAPSWDLITLTHTDASGHRRYQPDPDVVSAEAARAPDSMELESRSQPTSASGPAPKAWTVNHDDPPPF